MIKSVEVVLAHGLCLFFHAFNENYINFKLYFLHLI